MSHTSGLLIDLDGTIYSGKQKIDHADEFVHFIKSQAIPYLFVTNNSSRTPGKVAAHLCDLGIEAQPQHVYTAAQAAAQFIAEQNQSAKVACVGEEGLLTALQEAGLEVITGREQPDYVVQGIDRQFTYDKLEWAARLIRNGAVYVLTNPDMLLPNDHGLVPGAGSIAASIQAAAQMKPIVIGKPAAIMMKYAMERIGLAPEDVWVLGDNLHTDIGAGIAAGCRTALVLTGITTRHNLAEQIQLSATEADIVCERLLDFIPCLQGEGV